MKTILNARIEIRDIQEETPSITKKTILLLWERSFDVAIIEVEEEMNGYGLYGKHTDLGRRF